MKNDVFDTSVGSNPTVVKKTFVVVLNDKSKSVVDHIFGQSL